MLPQVEKRQVVPLTVDQVRNLAEAMEDRYRIGAVSQAALSLHTSELLAVQVGDVDFLRRTVPLARDLVQVLSQHVATYPPNGDGVSLTTEHENPVRSAVVVVDGDSRSSSGCRELRRPALERSTPG